MRVRAKFVSEKGREGRVVGYYGDKRVREGQIFTLVPLKRKDGTILSVQQQFSKNWMEQVDRMPATRTEPEKTKVLSAPGGNQTPPADDPIGNEKENTEGDQIPSDDTNEKTGSDSIPGQPGGSNSDVI